MKKSAFLLSAILFALGSVLSYAQAPVPFINLPLMPDATPPGGSDFTITINGTGFVSNSVVNWNGTPLQTQFVSQSQLTATVPAADIAMANTASAAVASPLPGGGTSNVAFFATTAKEDLVAFKQASLPGVGIDPEVTVAGDFNRDGNLDLAVVNWCGSDPSCNSPGSASILLGDGTGNFSLVSSPTVGRGPWYVATGDFNGDGRIDLAVVNDGCGNLGYGCGNTGTVSILLGDGLGNFTLASSASAGIEPTSMAVGDFNGDGKLDMAVVNKGADWGNGSNLYILLGDGTGDFQLASSLLQQQNPAAVAVGDFNADGKLDLAVAKDRDAVYILLGDGAGKFNLFASPAQAGWHESVAVADFNSDGRLDIAVDNFYEGTVSILLGNGDGNFAPISSSTAGPYPRSMKVEDFNGDGKLDLALINSDVGSGASVSVMLGDGAGNLTLVSTLPTGDTSYSVTPGDFNGDGKLDMAVPLRRVNELAILQSGVFPLVTVSPPSLYFDTQVLGTNSPPQPLNLTNSGNATLEIAGLVVSKNFSQTNNCPRKLLPGRQCTAKVVFAPRDLNQITGTIMITDNAPDSPQTIPLQGAGTVITLLPPSMDFGDQPVGTTSTPQVATLTNYAPKTVIISSVKITGDKASFKIQSTTCRTHLPAKESCTFEVVFAPKRKARKSATIEVYDNGGASPQSVALNGNGT